MGDTSILAPSVQELAKQGIQKVPEQYLLRNQDPIVVSNTTSLTQLPIINFDKLLCEDDAEIEKLDQVCKEWGFFQVWINYFRPFFNRIFFVFLAFTISLNLIRGSVLSSSGSKPHKSR
jgi:hypothetical protein